MEDPEATLLFNHRYEQAQDLLDSLLGLRSAWLGDQREKDKPDQAEIVRLRAEQALLSSLRHRLLSMSLVEITQLIEQYSPQYAEEIRLRKASHATRGLA